MLLMCTCLGLTLLHDVELVEGRHALAEVMHNKHSYVVVYCKAVIHVQAQYNCNPYNMHSRGKYDV